MENYYIKVNVDVVIDDFNQGENEYGWQFSSIFVNQKNNIVIEFVRDFKPTYTISGDDIPTLLKEIAALFENIDFKFDILKKTNTNIFL